MNLPSILLKIINKLDGERSIYASYHLLRGKRSGQTLQDVEYYQLKDYFGILPKLSKEEFDLNVNRLITAKHIEITADSIVRLTYIGKNELSKMDEFYFRGWDYRGSEKVFYARLSLLIQTYSNLLAQNKSFLPIQKEYEIQTFVKAFLLKYVNLESDLIGRLNLELQLAFEKSSMSEVQKKIFVYRLTGFQLTGLTWGQLADHLKIEPMSVRLLLIEGLHRLLDVIEMSDGFPLLKKLAEGVKVNTYLTQSCLKTKDLFEKNFSIEEIAKKRSLKVSTIEDHFVEMSLNDPDFPISNFISKDKLIAVLNKSEELGTMRLRLLKAEFETLSFFQLRLILGSKSGGRA